MKDVKNRPGGTVCIGASGTSTAFGLIQSIRDHWERKVRIVSSDTNKKELVAAVIYGDDYLRVHQATDKAFVDDLVKKLIKKRVNIYIPIHDQEIFRVVSRYVTPSWPRSIYVLSSGIEAIEICNDKWKTYKWLRKNGFPTPATWLPQSGAVREDVVLKPREGVGSIGVEFVDKGARLRDENDYVLWVAQSVCKPPEITIDGFISPKGDYYRSVCRERIEVKAGVCTKARVFSDKELNELTYNVATSLGLRGAFCIQVMSGSDGTWQIVDINPRLGGGTRMSAAVGMDFGAAWFASAIDDDYEQFFSRMTGEHYVVRQYREVVTK